MYRKKLIEVDLPLDDINKESVQERYFRHPTHGHPFRLHPWWARRPLAACRAVIFSSMVDDPSSCPEEFPTEEAQRKERKRLHDIIRKMVEWESTDESTTGAVKIRDEARYEIARSVARSRNEPAPDADNPDAVLRYLGDNALPIYDPFAGGGSIPLEAQRLGLRAVASDLNPVAVLINKALIELPPKFGGKPPVNSDADPMHNDGGQGEECNERPLWRGAAGLADDIRYYGKWMRDEAEKRIGHLYPKAKLPDGREATVAAWLWARTVPCQNPACGIAMPLMTTFQLSKKPKNRHWVRPVVDREAGRVRFVVQDNREGVPTSGRTVNRNGATCISCNTTAPLAYVREQSRAGKMGEQMTAVVAEGNRRRVFLSPTDEDVQVAISAKPNKRSIPWQKMPTTAYKVSGRGYGITEWRELFTQRQLVTLGTLSDLMPEVRTQMLEDKAHEIYASTIHTYLALAIGKQADICSSFARWQNSGDKAAGVFGRQAIPMVWDFAESNPFSKSTGNWMFQIEMIANTVQRLPTHVNSGIVHQADATTTIHAARGPVIVTDPPYYDNISYAELSDYFYVWLRPLLRDIYPDLFAGVLVPIQEEMIAAPRFESKDGESAKDRFERLMRDTLRLIWEKCSPEFPSSIFYAYKQREEERDGVTSTGWDTMLTALVDARFQIVGTWPMRTELANRTNSLDANSLASSVVLVCRPRAEDAEVATRRQFLDALEAELPGALDRMTREGHIAPVDLSQAAIGPGMEVYSRYAGVETIAGERVPVRDALREINRVIVEYHQREQGELDVESQFCVEWLREHGYVEGEFGRAETLSQAKNVSIEALRDAHGLLEASAGKLRLLRVDEYAPDGRRRLRGDMTAWEGCMRMAWHMRPGDDRLGVEGASAVGREMGGGVESVERLARILYDYFDGRGDSANAVTFNTLVTSWGAIDKAMREPERPTLDSVAASAVQGELGVGR